MGQDIGSGRTLVGAGWTMQPDHALQPLEAKFHSPAQTIQGQHVIGGEFRGRERSHQDEPVGGREGLLREPIAVLLRLTAGLAPALRSSGVGLADGDQAQRQRRTALASDPYGLIDPPVRRGLAEGIQQVERLAVLLLPAGILPAGPHDDIAAILQYAGNAVWLQVHAVGDADLTLHHRNAIQLLALVLVGQHEMTKPLAGKIERTMDPPEPVPSLRRGARLGYRTGIEDAD